MEQIKGTIGFNHFGVTRNQGKCRRTEDKYKGMMSIFVISCGTYLGKRALIDDKAKGTGNVGGIHRLAVCVGLKDYQNLVPEAVSL